MKSLTDGWVSFDVLIQMKDSKVKTSTATDQTGSEGKPKVEEG